MPMLETEKNQLITSKYSVVFRKLYLKETEL